MNIENIHRGHSTKTVRIVNIADDRPVSDDLLKGFAMKAANEDPSSLFGTEVIRDHEARSATVRLHTD